MAAVIADLVNGVYDWLFRQAAIGPSSRRAQRFGRFGDGSMISFPPQSIYNEHAISIGQGVLIGPRCAITVGMAPGQDLIAETMLTIGDRSLIGRGCSIAAHFSIVIGDDVFFGPNVYVTDQNHANDVVGVPVGAQSQPEQPVIIGARSWLATGVVVTPGVTIGEEVMVGANSVVTHDLPDRCVAGGVPARVIKQN